MLGFILESLYDPVKFFVLRSGVFKWRLSMKEDGVQVKNTNDFKVSIYCLIIGVACTFLRAITSPNLPTNISLVIGGILLVIAFFLSFMEVKNNLGFTYAYAENWRGDGLVNSGLILGIANYFFALNKTEGIFVALALGILLFLSRMVYRKILA